MLRTTALPIMLLIAGSPTLGSGCPDQPHHPTTARRQPQKPPPANRRKPPKTAAPLVRLVKQLQKLRKSKKTADLGKVLAGYVSRVPKGCRRKGHISSVIYPRKHRLLRKVNVPPGLLVFVEDIDYASKRSWMRACAVWTRGATLTIQELKLDTGSSPSTATWSEHPPGKALLHLKIQDGLPFKSEDNSDTSHTFKRQILLHVDKTGPRVIGAFKGEEKIEDWGPGDEAKKTNRKKHEVTIALKWQVIGSRHVLSMEKMVIKLESESGRETYSNCAKHWAAYAYEAKQKQLVKVTGAAEKKLVKAAPFKQYASLTGNRSGSCADPEQ